MALTLLSPPLSPPLSHALRTLSPSHCTALFSSFPPPPTPLPRLHCTTGKDGATSERSPPPPPPPVRTLDDDLIRRISAAKDADQAADLIIAELGGGVGMMMRTSECNSLVIAALERGNADLALSLFDAMRSGFSPDDGVEGKVAAGTWRWPRPDIRTYALLVQGLAAALRVTDAIQIIGYVCGMGVSAGDEVLFGLVIQCPTCKVAIAVAQPQNGTQIASCSKCRYQYELFSGDIVSIESEDIRISPCRTQREHLRLGKGFDFAQSKER